MTHDERAREAERLMALLDGQGNALVIDETGELTPAPVEEEPLDCLLCFAALDEEVVVLDDGAHLCPDCVPEYQALMQLEVVCPICPASACFFGATPTWGREVRLAAVRDVPRAPLGGWCDRTLEWYR